MACGFDAMAADVLGVFKDGAIGKAIHRAVVEIAGGNALGVIAVDGDHPCVPSPVALEKKDRVQTPMLFADDYFVQLLVLPLVDGDQFRSLMLFVDAEKGKPHFDAVQDIDYLNQC